jgi:hypothetical protein
MRNIIILGTGRSGTSMVAATFRSSGAFMGDHLLPATPSNPNGYYEDRGINILNNDLIRRLVGRPLLGWRVRNRVFRNAHTVPSAFFLAAPRRLRRIQPSPAELSRIQSFANRAPFCYKDPRFSVTLPTWTDYLPADTGFVVVFRDPMRTVDSILRDAKEQYEPPLPVTKNWGYIYWHRTYSRLLSFSENSSTWLFLNYDAVVDRSATERLSDFVATPLDFDQIDKRTSRSSSQEWPESKIARSCRHVYERLCERANVRNRNNRGANIRMASLERTS